MVEYYSESELLANAYWKDKRFDWDGGALIYIAFNRAINASPSASTWKIWKLTWDGTSLIRTQGPIEGSYDNRASLGW